MDKEIDTNYQADEFSDHRQQNAVDYGEDYAGWNEAENMSNDTRNHLGTENIPKNNQPTDLQFASIDGLRKGGRLIVN